MPSCRYGNWVDWHWTELLYICSWNQCTSLAPVCLERCATLTNLVFLSDTMGVMFVARRSRLSSIFFSIWQMHEVLVLMKLCWSSNGQTSSGAMVCRQPLNSAIDCLCDWARKDLGSIGIVKMQEMGVSSLQLLANKPTEAWPWKLFGQLEVLSQEIHDQTQALQKDIREWLGCVTKAGETNTDWPKDHQQRSRISYAWMQRVQTNKICCGQRPLILAASSLDRQAGTLSQEAGGIPFRHVDHKVGDVILVLSLYFLSMQDRILRFVPKV